ncbi:hypothetical protein [Vulgatibacter incomptus]|uniref:Lipoprotein n=1 Tax=Vulgatibacter incomptus TaxID=1391653 RepID=A0A0K1PGB4_9BACT|nr:hypothetical protein [Vulgatibacter incomptus]AKU92149.1 hypothetical protein AKJ08_2536 [Vulgatibacter incomptus]
MKETLALVAFVVALTGFTLQPILSEDACSGSSSALDRGIAAVVRAALDDGGSALVARDRLRAEGMAGMVVDRCLASQEETHRTGKEFRAELVRPELAVGGTQLALAARDLSGRRATGSSDDRPW